ncbi:hypothetical protein BDZ91DRAFT_765159 [Kalaharituber pfeilii]|nr:hypothetical protein BDZ91DRAFT_765159 [Kalaharituber pfeilii]
MHRGRRGVLKSAGIGSRTTSTAVAFYYLKRLKVPYPAIDTWVAETSTTFTNWAHYMETYTLADERHTLEVGKSFWLDNPGKMVLQGYTTGNLSKPAFEWVKNHQAKYSDSDKKEYYQQVSAAFAIFWNLMCEKLPEPIISDFEEFLTDTGIPRMHYPDTPPIFSVTHTFSQQPLAPPSGQTTTNYAGIGNV